MVKLDEADDPSETTQGAIHVFELGPEAVRLNINVTSDGNQAGNARVQRCWQTGLSWNMQHSMWPPTKIAICT